MLEHAGAGGWAGKRVAISGSGNVAQYAALKCIELGAKVISLSDSKGCIIAEGDACITPDDVTTIAALKVERKALTDFDHSKFKYIHGARPWVHAGKVDVALPCATQNEVSKEEAEALVACGTRFVAEGSNMGCTQDAIDVFEADRLDKKAEAIWYAPGESPSPPPRNHDAVLAIRPEIVHGALRGCDDG
jgi:glutamate dehydrogenase (NADP+)